MNDLRERYKPILSYGLKSIGYLHKREIKRFYDRYKLNPYPLPIFENDNEVGRVDNIFIICSVLYGKVFFYKEDYNKDIKACFGGELKGHKGYDKPKKIYPIKIKTLNWCEILNEKS